jgi:hypothetical protein
MAWQSIQYVTTGLGLVAFALAGIFYFLRYRLKQRAEIIRSASAKDRLDAIALAAYARYPYLIVDCSPQHQSRRCAISRFLPTILPT